MLGKVYSKGADHEFSLDNALGVVHLWWDYNLEYNDMDSLNTSPTIWPKAGFLNLQAIESSGFNECVKDVHLGQNALNWDLETMTLKYC